MFATRNGMLKKMSFDLLPKRGNVTKVITLMDNDMLADIDVIENKNTECNITLVTSDGKALSMTQDKIRETGKSGRGVKGIKLSDNNYVVKVIVTPSSNDSNSKKYLLTITENGFAKQTSCNAYASKGRNGRGVTSHKITEESGQVVSAAIVDNHDELLVSTKYGKMIRLKLSSIRSTGRVSMGVRLIRLNDNDTIASVSVIDTTEESDKEENITS